MHKLKIIIPNAKAANTVPNCNKAHATPNLEHPIVKALSNKGDINLSLSTDDIMKMTRG